MNYELQLAFQYIKGIPLAHITRSESELEPLHALVAGAVGKRFRVETACGFLLQVVVANDRCTFDSLAQVAVIQRFEGFVLVLAPHAGIEVGLELNPHTDLVSISRVHAVHLRMRLIKGAE